MADESIFLESPENDNYANYPVKVPEFAHIDKMAFDVARRQVYVGGEIDETFGEWFCSVMSHLEAKGDEAITVWLNTPGGDVTSMFVFNDLVRASKCHVRVVASGQVCSAGVLMLACANERIVTESCVLMSHRSEGEMVGNVETMQARLEWHKWCDQHWAVLMARYTPEEVSGSKRDVKYWANLGRRKAEWWLFGAEAIIAEGLADAVWPNIA